MSCITKARYNVRGKKIDSVWNVTVIIYDEFDFTEFANPLTKSEIEDGTYQFLKGIVL